MKKMTRSLNLLSICSLACGAMLSGILVLPGHAADIGGPSVYLAFLLAGLLFLPAALSKAEMATALPEAGGDYVFIDRALGPAVSTVTGIGTWLLLVLKSAFALAGLGAYLTLVAPIPPGQSLYVAAGIGLLLILLNGVGVKKSGQVQAVLVGISILVLLVFAERGAVRVDPSHFVPFLPNGTFGFIGATAFVFVSYAGVTKVASAAEEVKNPDRNIPLGILLSLTFMILLYSVIAYVYVGLVPATEYGKNAGPVYANAPIAQAALILGGRWVEYAVSLVAVLALTSMANAGLLASSRYPMAMGRHEQLPETFARINPSTGTPLLAVGTTGGIMLFSLIFLPVMQLAKLASGFLLVMFAILNLSVVIFRESEIEWYKPSFRAPVYPYLQLLGTMISLVLLPFLGVVTLIGSLGLCALGLGWYFVYVAGDVSRQSTIRRGSVHNFDREVTRSVEQSLLNETHRDRIVLIPVFNLSESELLDAQRRIETVLSLFGNNYTFKVIHLHEAADRYFLSDEFEPDEVDTLLERFVRRLNKSGKKRVTFDCLSTERSRGFVRHFCEKQPVAFTVLGWKESPRWKFLVSRSEWWLEDFPSELLMVKNSGPTRFEDVNLFTHCFPDGDQALALSTAGAVARDLAVPLDVHLQGLSGEDADGGPRLDRFNSYFKHLLNDGRSLRRLLTLGESDGTLGRHQLVVLDSTVSLESVQERLTPSTTVIRPLSSGKSNSSLPGVNQSLGGHLRTDSLYLDTWKPLSKRALFHEIARRFAEDGFPTHEVERSLWETEKAYSTYRTAGYAVPHGFVDDSVPAVKIFPLDRAVTYETSRETVELCVAVIGPSDRAEDVLNLVRLVDEQLTDEEVVRLIREAEEPEDVLKRFRGEPVSPVG